MYVYMSMYLDKCMEMPHEDQKRPQGPLELS